MQERTFGVINILSLLQITRLDTRPHVTGLSALMMAFFFIFLKGFMSVCIGYIFLHFFVCDVVIDSPYLKQNSAYLVNKDNTLVLFNSFLDMHIQMSKKWPFVVLTGVVFFTKYIENTTTVSLTHLTETKQILLCLYNCSYGFHDCMLH